MAVRAVRGATRLEADEPAAMREAVVELLAAMLERNSLVTDDLISILFTATPDLVSEFPATSARALDLADVPLICAQELAISGSMTRVIRIMAHVECDLPRASIQHVFLRDASALRSDLTT